MTDNNADETDGQGINLSRRGAVALLGTSAVGGTVATGAFSQLTADRPVDVEVVSSGGDSETADPGNSTLQITNNLGETVSVEFENTDTTQRVTPLAVNTTNTSTSRSVSRITDSSWNVSSIDPGETVHVPVTRNSTSASVDFDVNAFTGTSGYEIGTTQNISVNGPPSSAVARWTFDGVATTNNTTFDVWGGNDGGLNGSSIATGVSGANVTYDTGEAIDFNSSDYVTVPHNSALDPSSNFSWSFWVNFDKKNAYENIVNRYGGQVWADGTFGFATRITNGNGFNTALATGSGIIAAQGQGPTTDRWYHVTSTYDASLGSDNLKLYIDGAQDASATGTANYTEQSQMLIGSSETGEGYINGKVSDFRFYNKTLSSTEVSNLYTNGDISDSS